MSGIITEYRGKCNANIASIVCDTEKELLEDAPTTTKIGSGVFKDYNFTIPIGSQGIVKTDSGVVGYLLFSDGWTPVK